MTVGRLLPKLLAFAVPVLLSGVLQLAFNAADLIVVGRFCGENALAAVGSNMSLVSLLVNVLMGTGTGASVLAARYFGASWWPPWAASPSRSWASSSRERC